MFLNCVVIEFEVLSCVTATFYYSISGILRIIILTISVLIHMTVTVRKCLFPAITYDSSRPAMHLKTRLSDFLVFIVLTSVLFALPDMNNTQCIFFISCFYPSNALVEFVFVGSDNAFRPPHTII